MDVREAVGQSIERFLRPIFGCDSYRGQQEKAIEAAVQGFDSFVLMPTGLSFQ